MNNSIKIKVKAILNIILNSIRMIYLFGFEASKKLCQIIFLIIQIKIILSIKFKIENTKSYDNFQNKGHMCPKTGAKI